MSFSEMYKTGLDSEESLRLLSWDAESHMPLCGGSVFRMLYTDLELHFKFRDEFKDKTREEIFAILPGLVRNYSLQFLLPPATHA